jgi:colanic acid biosynthesis glycosyl transferase WcaI
MHTDHQGKTRILIYGINYSPEPVGIGKYTGELSRWLSANGFEVRVITAPSYFPQWKVQKNYYWREDENNITIFRCPLWVPRRPNGLTRLVHLSSFAISSMPVVLGQVRWKPDIIFTVAPAFFCSPASLLLKLLCQARGKQVQARLHIQDFELDAAFELGILKGRLIREAAILLERLILRSFDRVSTISLAMRNLAIKKGVDERACIFMPNWVNTSSIYPQEIEARGQNPYRISLGIKSYQTVITYSGSMNKKQGLETLAEAIIKLQSREDIVWAIAGEGPSKDEFTKEVRDIRNVRLLPLQPTDHLNDWLNLGDIHLLPQKKGAADLVLPSKLLGIMACGKAMIAASPENTELARFGSRAGIRVDPEDSQQLINAILTLVLDKELRNHLGNEGRRLAVEYFDQEKVLMHSWKEELFMQLPNLST